MRFLFLDEILEMRPGRSIRGRKQVAPDEDYFRDHFPGFPVVPGVLLTEMMAQTAGRCLDAEDPARGRSMLARVQQAHFRRWVRPGDLAVIAAEILTSRTQYATARCRVEVNDLAVASADLFFTFVRSEPFAAGWRDEVLERFLREHPELPCSFPNPPPPPAPSNSPNLPPQPA